MIRKVNRRGFLQTGMVGAAGLTLGFFIFLKRRGRRARLCKAECVYPHRFR